MTQDEIIEMLRQSDLEFLLGDNWMMHHEFVAFANLVAAKEREACAKEADEYANQVFEHNFSKLIAHNIRARGQA